MLTNTTWSKFPNERKAIAEQMLVSEEIYKSKRAGLWESQPEIWVGKLTFWVRSSEIEKLQQHSQVYQFYQNRFASPYDGGLSLSTQSHQQMGWSRERHLSYMKKDEGGGW